MQDRASPVLIVGGGLAGLSVALFLAWRGVQAVLVERRAGSSPHPRAVGFTTRTLEIYRAVGIGADIPQVPPGHGRPRRVAVESLTGKWSDEVRWSQGQPPPSRPGEPPPPRIAYSPCTGAAIAQDRLEPLIRDHAVKLGADIRLNTELVSFEARNSGVTARLRQWDGLEYTLQVSYLIAADGHSSLIREALDIGRSGHGFMHVVRSILFRAPAIDHYLDSGISQFELDQPALKGMLTSYRDGRWLLMIKDDAERDATAQKQMVDNALGRSDIPVELITSGRWVLSALIADTFKKGRVFLVGDAAHTLPPARGGYGANTGIEDAYNLAWKLAAVIASESTPALLDSYDPERRPIAWLRHNQIFARQDYASVATEEEKKVTVIEDDAMELGQLYRSSAVLGAGDDLPPALRPEQWAGQPGTRAPHLWVSKKRERVSTLDLLQRDWTLITRDERWCIAAGQVGKDLSIKLGYLHVSATPDGHDTSRSPPTLTPSTPTSTPTSAPAPTSAPTATPPPNPGAGTLTPSGVPADPAAFLQDFQTAFGIGPAGAALVRPDGYVAWRSRDLPGDPARLLIEVLSRVAAATLAKADMS